jgi:hypothetical protein
MDAIAKLKSALKEYAQVSHEGNGDNQKGDA